MSTSNSYYIKEIQIFNSFNYINNFKYNQGSNESLKNIIDLTPYNFTKENTFIIMAHGISTLNPFKIPNNTNIITYNKLSEPICNGKGNYGYIKGVLNNNRNIINIPTILENNKPHLYLSNEEMYDIQISFNGSLNSNNFLEIYGIFMNDFVKEEDDYKNVTDDEHDLVKYHFDNLWIKSNRFKKLVEKKMPYEEFINTFFIKKSLLLSELIKIVNNLGLEKTNFIVFGCRNLNLQDKDLLTNTKLYNTKLKISSSNELELNSIIKSKKIRKTKKKMYKFSTKANVNNYKKKEWSLVPYNSKKSKLKINRLKKVKESDLSFKIKMYKYRTLLLDAIYNKDQENIFTYTLYLLIELNELNKYEEIHDLLNYTIKHLNLNYKVKLEEEYFIFLIDNKLYNNYQLTMRYDIIMNDLFNSDSYNKKYNLLIFKLYYHLLLLDGNYNNSIIDKIIQNNKLIDINLSKCKNNLEKKHIILQNFTKLRKDIKNSLLIKYKKIWDHSQFINVINFIMAEMYFYLLNDFKKDNKFIIDHIIENSKTLKSDNQDINNLLTNKSKNYDLLIEKYIEISKQYFNKSIKFQNFYFYIIIGFINNFKQKKRNSLTNNNLPTYNNFIKQTSHK